MIQLPQIALNHILSNSLIAGNQLVGGIVWVAWPSRIEDISTKDEPTQDPTRYHTDNLTPVFVLSHNLTEESSRGGVYSNIRANFDAPIESKVFAIVKEGSYGWMVGYLLSSDLESL